MAIFSNLFHLTDALVAYLKAGVSTSVTAAPPPESPTGNEGIYLSLTYLVEQPAHRNDGYVRDPDGTSRPPPFTASVYYLVTTYGSSPTSADAAHRLLGQVAQLVHDDPLLDLGAGDGGKGSGQLGLTQVPMTPELMEKLFQTRAHRPFIFLEVAPVQLETKREARPAAPVVRPGGVALVGPRPSASPPLVRVTPSAVAQDGWIAVDGPFPGTVAAVAVGKEVLRGAALAVLGGPAGRVRVKLDAATFAPGIYPVRVTLAGGEPSDEAAVEVLAAAAWSLDAPAFAAHSLASGPLALSGRNLGAARDVFFWPDAGVRGPSDVHVAPIATPAADGVTVTPPVGPGTWRIAVSVVPAAGVPQQYTPYVVLEVTP